MGRRGLTGHRRLRGCAAASGGSLTWRGAGAPSRRLCPGAGWSTAGSAGSEPAGLCGTPALPQTGSPAPSRGPLPSRLEAQPGGPARCSSRPAQQQEPALRAGDPRRLLPPPWPPCGEDPPGASSPGPRKVGSRGLAASPTDGGREPEWGPGEVGARPPAALREHPQARCPPLSPTRAAWGRRTAPSQVRGRAGGSLEAPGHQAAGSAPAASCWPLGGGGGGGVYIR